MEYGNESGVKYVPFMYGKDMLRLFYRQSTTMHELAIYLRNITGSTYAPSFAMLDEERSTVNGNELVTEFVDNFKSETIEAVKTIYEGRGIELDQFVIERKEEKRSELTATKKKEKVLTDMIDSFYMMRKKSGDQESLGEKTKKVKSGLVYFMKASNG